jgi:hypothetical protein
MDITTLVISYRLTNVFCTTALVSACMVGSQTKDARKRVVRVARSGGTWHYVATTAQAR